MIASIHKSLFLNSDLKLSVFVIFFSAIIEDGYHWRNPYHNAVHAADVTQAMHCFLQESMILEHLTPLEIFCALLAAVTHDLDHPGVNQPFLIATSNHLAALYKVKESESFLMKYKSTPSIFGTKPK